MFSIAMLLLFGIVSSCKEQIPEDMRDSSQISSIDESTIDDTFEDDTTSEPAIVSGSFLVGKVLNTDKTSPVQGALVYLPENPGVSVLTDADGKFKLPVSTDSDTVDLFIIKESEGLGKVIKDIPAPSDEKGGRDLGNIVLESTGAVKGQFLLNAEDHPDMFRVGRKNLIKYFRFNVEIWRPDQHGSVFNAPIDVDGSFLVRGIAPGTWRVKFYAYDDDFDISWDGYVQDIEVKAGRTTILNPGSAVEYDGSFFGAIISGLDKVQNKAKILNLSPLDSPSSIHVVSFDSAASLINSYVVDYEKEIELDLPSGIKTLKISYRYKVYDGNGYSVGISHTPFFVFDINMNDRDGDGFDDLVDCDPDDATKYYTWTNLVKDGDGDGFYPPPEENLCGGFDFPDGYILVQKDFKFDCDDNDPQKNKTISITDGDGKKYPFCWNLEDPVPGGYTYSGSSIGSSLNFETDPSKPDIYFISAYEFRDSSPGTGEIILPELLKDTYIYIASYHTTDITVLTNGGESFLKGVYRVGYDPQKTLTVMDQASSTPQTGFDTYSSDKGYFTADGFSFSNWYNEDNHSGDYNHARSGLIGLPVTIGGNVKFLYAHYAIGGPIKVDLISP
jgi:hypothetical protein